MVETIEDTRMENNDVTHVQAIIENSTRLYDWMKHFYNAIDYSTGKGITSGRLLKALDELRAAVKCFDKRLTTDLNVMRVRDIEQRAGQIYFKMMDQLEEELLIEDEATCNCGLWNDGEYNHDTD